jgi:Tfp pilus assembly protein PilX
VVVVVAVCVLLLLTVLAVGVLRLRSAHKRAAEEEVEMAWDDTALNITVNPLEASIKQRNNDDICHN